MAILSNTWTFKHISIRYLKSDSLIFDFLFSTETMRIHTMDTKGKKKTKQALWFLIKQNKSIDALLNKFKTSWVWFYIFWSGMPRNKCLEGPYVRMLSDGKIISISI